MGRICALDRRQRKQIGLEVAHIALGHGRIGRVGKCREVMASVRGEPPVQCVYDLFIRPAADSRFDVGRDVGAVEIAERGFQPAAACQGRALVGLVRVAGGTACGIEYVLPAFDGLRVVVRTGRTRAE